MKGGRREGSMKILWKEEGGKRVGRYYGRRKEGREYEDIMEGGRREESRKILWKEEGGREYEDVMEEGRWKGVGRYYGRRKGGWDVYRDPVR